MRKWLLTMLVISSSLLSGEEFVLSLNSSEQYAITEIISSMGEKNVGMLLLDVIRLRRLGDSIEQVPPLQFLGFVLTNPYLKSCLKKISKSSFKWSSFIDGFGGNMEKEYFQGKILPELQSFAELVGGSLEQLEGYVYHQEWEKFVKCLL